MPTTSTITPGQIAATRAIKRFCELHGHASGWQERLGVCLSALESREPIRIQESLRPFLRAGMGSFVDWFPSPVPPSEDANYVEVLWNAIYQHWRNQLQPRWPKT